MSGTAVASGESWVSPEKMALCPGPGAIKKRDFVALAVEIAISIAGEVSCAAGDGEVSRDTFPRVLRSTNVRLMVAKAQVFRPKLGASFDRHPSLAR